MRLRDLEIIHNFLDKKKRFISQWRLQQNMTYISIRIANENDLEILMNMEFELFKKWSSIDEIDKINSSWFFSSEHKEKTLKLLKSKKDRIYVAILDNKIVGYLKCHIKKREPFLKKVGHISEAFILERYRSKKIGTKLLDVALNWFRENGLIWTTASTHSLDTEANIFWEKKGYKEFNKYFKMRL